MTNKSESDNKSKVWELVFTAINIFLSLFISLYTANSVSKSNYKNNYTSSIVNYKVSQLKELDENLSDYTTLVSNEQFINKNIQFKIEKKDGKETISINNLDADNTKEIQQMTTEINNLKTKIILSIDLENKSHKKLLSHIKTSDSYIRDSSLARDLGMSNYSTTEELFLENNEKNILVNELVSDFKKYETDEKNHIDDLIKE